MSVIITITRAQLAALDACAEGMALFDAIVSHQDFGVRDAFAFEWTPLSDVYWALSGHANWLCSRRIIPAANLSRAYLSGAYLSGAYLSRTDLSRTDLFGANLSGADLSGADLGDWKRGEGGYARRKHA